MTQYAEILSFGGGVNSVALAVMAINDGWRGEIVFADTGCEWPETMCYLSYFERQVSQITRIGPKQVHSRDVKRGENTLLEYCEMLKVCPMPAARWCTVEWKVGPLERYAEGRTQMLGIAADEAHRQPDKVRPLVDRGISRKGCIEIIEAAGLDVPQKSGCYICPFQRNYLWRLLWERHPELFERAAKLEEDVLSRCGVKAALDPSGKLTLRQRELAYRSQIALPEIDMDGLLAYKPCVCEVT